MDKLLRNSLVGVCVAAVVLLGAAATILIQVAYQLHQTPNLMLKAEATVDYLGRAAKNFDDATKVWKEASQNEADYLHNTLPKLTTQVQTDLTTSNELLKSVKDTSDTVGDSIFTLSNKTNQTLSAVNELMTTANQTVAGLQPTEIATTEALVRFHTSLDLFNATLSDPNLKATMFNVAGMTATGNHMLETADKVETKASHNYLYPSSNPFVRGWQVAQPFLLPAATAASRIIP